MTDLEISKALALAIGWKPEQLEVFNGNMLCIEVGPSHLKEFRYDSWNVTGPIAERYGCFPQRRYYTTGDAYWSACVREYFYADTPQKAIALAVIGGMK